MNRSIIPLCLALAGCGVPQFEDATDTPWLEGVSREFQLAVDRPFLTTVNDVRLRYTRHSWPGTDKANTAPTKTDPDVPEISTGTRSLSVPEGWIAVAPELGAAPRTHHVFYRWELDYTRPFGLGSGTIASREYQGRDDPGLNFVIGCTPEMQTAYLQEMQDAVLQVHDRENPMEGPSPYLSHGFVSLAGNGVGFAYAGAGSIGQAPGYPVAANLDTSLTPVPPAIVLYRPQRKEGQETDDQYRARITDLNIDLPYKIMGWAYGVLYTPQQRPVMGCIPSSEWFVHEAGYHLTNGGMAIFPVNEDIAGTQTVGAVLPPPGFFDPNATFWHGRVWDLHVWLVDDDDPETPELSINHPEGMPGLDLGPVFFYPETFE